MNVSVQQVLNGRTCRQAKINHESVQGLIYSFLYIYIHIDTVPIACGQSKQNKCVKSGANIHVYCLLYSQKYSIFAKK